MCENIRVPPLGEALAQACPGKELWLGELIVLK